MHPHTKFGIPTSKNIGDMHRTRSGTDGRTDGRTDGQTDGRTVRLLHASQSSFGGIKNVHMYYIGVTERKIENLKKEGKMRISILIFIYTIQSVLCK